MAQKSKISIVRILLNDYPAFLPVMFALVMWGIYLVLIIGWDVPDIRPGGKGVSSEDACIVFWIAIVVTIAFLPVALWRIRLIRGVFARGIVIKGKIVRLKKIRARGLQTSARVKFKYSYNGKEFVKSNWLLSWDLEKDEGDSLDLALLADKPGRALIKEVYDPE